jgi:hypothetical protein
VFEKRQPDDLAAVQVPASMIAGTAWRLSMSWEGIHLFQFALQASRFGSWELSARSPDVALHDLRLRPLALS